MPGITATGVGRAHAPSAPKFRENVGTLDAGAGAGASSFFAPAAALAAPSTATLAASALAFHLSTRIRTGAKIATTAAFAAFMVSRTFFLSSALSLLASLMDVRSPLSRPPREHLSGRKKEHGYRQYTEK